MSEEKDGRIILRLPDTPEGEMIKEWLRRLRETSLKKFNQSDAIREAVLAYIMGVTITFDPQDPRDQRIIQEIQHLEDEPRRMSEWIKARLWERLTGLDDITGQPLPQFVQVVETEKVVIQERVTLVEKPVFVGSQPQETEIAQSKDDKTAQAHKELDEVDW